MRCMYRYQVPDDGKFHMIPLSHDPVAVAATNASSVEFWAEHTDGATQIDRWFQVFGTGRLLPEQAKWVGTCARNEEGLIQHLYEVKL